MRSKIYPSEYLAFLATKYDVDVEKFFDALVSASKNQKSKCGSLSIEFRGKQEKTLSILITQGSNVVAQFRLPEEFLLEKRNPLQAALKSVYLKDKHSEKKIEPQSLRIKDLHIGMKKVNLKAKILEVSKATVVVTRFGNCASVANAMVSDETGQIKLCLWNDQIDLVTEGDIVEIENGMVSEYRHERQMRIGKNGTLRIA